MVVTRFLVSTNNVILNRSCGDMKVEHSMQRVYIRL